MAEPATSELFAAAIAGDERAWEDLVDRLEGAIWGATSRLRLSQSEAEDVFQTVWLRLLDRHETIRDPAALAGWLQQTAHYEGLAIIRRSGRETPSDLIDVREAPIDGPEVDVTRLADSLLMKQGFAKLSDECKDILYMSATKVPYREIAKRMGLAIGTLGSKRQRCLAVLRSFDEIKQVMESDR